MAFNIIVSDEAEAEAQIAVDYYDQINPDLGSRFLAELSVTYQKLELHPQYYSFVFSNRKSNIRDVKLESFPYLVIFEIRGQDVMIISVANTNKKPQFS